MILYEKKYNYIIFFVVYMITGMGWKLGIGFGR